MMMQSDLFQYGNDIPWEQTGEGVKRQVLGYDDNLMLVKVKFDKGGRGELHSHPHTQVSYVESGAFELTIGNVTRVIRRGDGYFVPPDTIHGCLCLEEGMLIDAFSPARRTFIDATSDDYIYNSKY
jgi:quercetin dioxygenase-like cupin family protein